MEFAKLFLAFFFLVENELKDGLSVFLLGVFFGGRSFGGLGLGFGLSLFGGGLGLGLRLGFGLLGLLFLGRGILFLVGVFGEEVLDAKHIGVCEGAVLEGGFREGMIGEGASGEDGLEELEGGGGELFDFGACFWGEGGRVTLWELVGPRREAIGEEVEHGGGEALIIGGGACFGGGLGGIDGIGLSVDGFREEGAWVCEEGEVSEGGLFALEEGIDASGVGILEGGDGRGEGFTGGVEGIEALDEVLLVGGGGEELFELRLEGGPEVGGFLLVLGGGLEEGNLVGSVVGEGEGGFGTDGAEALKEVGCELRGRGLAVFLVDFGEACLFA